MCYELHGESTNSLFLELPADLVLVLHHVDVRVNALAAHPVQLHSEHPMFLA
jgi:hypothetical protein